MATCCQKKKKQSCTMMPMVNIPHSHTITYLLPYVLILFINLYMSVWMNIKRNITHGVLTCNCSSKCTDRQKRNDKSWVYGGQWVWTCCIIIHKKNVADLSSIISKNKATHRGHKSQHAGSASNRHSMPVKCTHQNHKNIPQMLWIGSLREEGCYLKNGGANCISETGCFAPL